MEEEIRASVDAAKAKGTFKITDVLAERGYPRDKVVIMMDEDAAYEASKIKENIEALDVKIAKDSSNAELIKQMEELSEKREIYLKRLSDSTFTFHLRGISEGQREEIYKKSVAKYPIQYDRDQDILRGETKITEKESPERDALFTDYLWLACIESISDPNGNEQRDITYTDVRAMRSSLPMAAMAKINQALEKLRVSTAVFMVETGEDFLAKP
jgi:hypothetical protein